MSTLTPRHLWICGGRRRDREHRLSAVDPGDALTPPVDAHRRHRGPYTAAGTIVRSLFPAAMRRPDLVRRYDIEILSVAPELSSVLPNSRETLTSMAIPAERTRFYARLRTVRIAHGVVELLTSLRRAEAAATLVIENVEHADLTDLEFLAIALRRIDPAVLRLVVCSGSEEIGEPLATSLSGYAERVAVTPDEPGPGAGERGDAVESAKAYVAGDCTSDDPVLVGAYEALDHGERALLHERRARELAELNEPSLALGAIPFHLAHGEDRAGAGARALHAATDTCVCNGFYAAGIELGSRALEVVDPKEQPELWWRLVTAVGLALSVTSRTREAQRLYEEARLHSISPNVHMAAGYSIAMLYTRHNDPADRDERQAKAWLNSSIATASLVLDPSERAFLSAFYRNGLALVEVNLGDPAEALRLVDECIDSLDRLLSPDEHRLHRTVLKNNRARVYAMLGRLDEALADYAVVIAADPNHAEHYLERGNIQRRLGRDDEAAADYERAIRLSPPFAEIYYNRADLRLGRGETDGALADFSYVLELDPDFVDAYINRAGLYLEAGEVDLALADAEAGLLRDPGNAHLLAVVGQAEAEAGRADVARQAFDRALAGDPDLLSALAGRAALAWRGGDDEGALRDLARAVQLSPDDPSLRFNRAMVHRDAARWQDALADLEAADALAPDDPDVAAARQACLAGLTGAGAGTGAGTGGVGSSA